MLWAKILKIEQTRKSRNGGCYQTVYFRTFDDKTKEAGSAKMDLVQSFRNYKNWENHLKLGATFKNIFFKKSHMIDADSPVHFVGIDEKIKDQPKLII